MQSYIRTHLLMLVCTMHQKIPSSLLHIWQLLLPSLGQCRLSTTGKAHWPDKRSPLPQRGNKIHWWQQWSGEEATQCFLSLLVMDLCFLASCGVIDFLCFGGMVFHVWSFIILYLLGHLGFSNIVYIFVVQSLPNYFRITQKKNLISIFWHNCCPNFICVDWYWIANNRKWDVCYLLTYTCLIPIELL